MWWVPSIINISDYMYTFHYRAKAYNVGQFRSGLSANWEIETLIFYFMQSCLGFLTIFSLTVKLIVNAECKFV